MPRTSGPRRPGFLKSYLSSFILGSRLRHDSTPGSKVPRDGGRNPRGIRVAWHDAGYDASPERKGDSAAESPGPSVDDSTQGREARWGTTRTRRPRNSPAGARATTAASSSGSCSAPRTGCLIRRIRAVAGDRPFRILDVGCGTGLFAARLKRRLAPGQGLGHRPRRRDAGQGRAALAAPRRRRSSRCRGTASGCRSPPGSFDFVTCANSFHHYPRQDRAVAEMHRVLRPGGRLLIIDGYRDAPWGWFIYDVCVAVRRGGRPPRLLETVPRADDPGRPPGRRPEGLPRPRPVPPQRGRSPPSPIPSIPAPHFRIRESVPDVGRRLNSTIPAIEAMRGR